MSAGCDEAVFVHVEADGGSLLGSRWRVGGVFGGRVCFRLLGLLHRFRRAVAWSRDALRRRAVSGCILGAGEAGLGEDGGTWMQHPFC